MWGVEEGGLRADQESGDRESGDRDWGRPGAGAPGRLKSWTGYHWLGVVSCLVLFIAAGLIAELVFEQVPHIEDEVAYLFQAQVFAMGRAYVDAPFHSNCFFAPFVLDHDGRRFGKYPPGWPALLALGVRLGQPWWVNAACAAVTAALVFRLGREMHGPLAGAIASGLTATSPFVLLLSGSLMSHPACLLFLTAFLWCTWRTRRQVREGWALAAGLALGMAFAIRPFTAVAIALPSALWALWRLLGTGGVDGEGEWRRIWYMGLGFAPLAALVPLANAVWTGDPLLSPYVLFWPYDRVGFGPGHGVLPGGNTVWLGVSSVVASLGHLANYLHGWPALSMTFVVLLFVFKPRQRRDLWLACTTLSLVGGYGLYWTSGDVYGPRYVYEASSALLILSAAGILRAAHWLQERGKRPILRYVLAGLMLVNLCVYLPWQLWRYHGLYGVTAAPRETLQAADLHNALVIVRDENGWKDYAVAFSMNRPTLDGDVVYANDCGPLVGQLVANYAGRAVYVYDGQSVLPYDPSDGG
jgi:4-amino-4-deoxy-L-arabinose transferase-like glycosyltransferase